MAMSRLSLRALLAALAIVALVAAPLAHGFAAPSASPAGHAAHLSHPDDPAGPDGNDNAPAPKPALAIPACCPSGGPCQYVTAPDLSAPVPPDVVVHPEFARVGARSLSTTPPLPPPRSRV